MIEWILLLLAILFEVSGTASMKMSEGFSRIWWGVAMVVFYIVSFAMLTLALKKIDVSVAYAIWSGVGTALIAIIGVYYFKEPLTAIKLASITLIIAGVVGLNLGGGVH